MLSINTNTYKCKPFYLFELSRTENRSAAAMRQKERIRRSTDYRNKFKEAIGSTQFPPFSFPYTSKSPYGKSPLEYHTYYNLRSNQQA
jgi:hypothetical protein